MEAYRYRVRCDENVLDFNSRISQPQDRLFIPGLGVLAYTGRTIDFFREDEEIMSEAKEILEKKRDGEYLGEICLPETTVMDVVCKGKALNKARGSFQKASESLVKRIERRK